MLLRLLKLLISVFIWLFDQCKYLSDIMQYQKTSHHGIILLYHNIKTFNRKSFIKQLNFIIDHCTPVFADEILSEESKKRNISITFDDANIGIIENGIKETIERNVPVTLFIPTGYLNQYPLWYKKGIEFKKDDKIINENELKNIGKNKLVKIGSHSITHQRMNNLNDSEKKDEIIHSKIYLEKVLDSKVTLFSFPFGIYDNSLIELCRKAGYQFTFSTLPVTTNFKKDEFIRGRIDVDPSDWIIEFKLKVLGAYRWLPYAFKIKGVLRTLLKIQNQ